MFKDDCQSGRVGTKTVVIPQKGGYDAPPKIAVGLFISTAEALFISAAEGSWC